MSSTQSRPIYRPYRFGDVFNRVSVLQKICRQTLLFFITPEDSTGESKVAGAPYHGSEFQGRIKALLWMAIAITLSVLMGQLL